MEEIEGLIQQVSKVKDGFKPIQAEAENILARYSTHDSLQIAYRLYVVASQRGVLISMLVHNK